MLKDIVTYLRFKHRRLIDSRSDSGFTIMELVIVLGIIGVLLTIVFLAIPRLTAAASNRSRDADVQTIYGAIKDYANAHNTALPVASTAGAVGAGKPFKAYAMTANPCPELTAAGNCFNYGDQFELGHYKAAAFTLMTGTNTNVAAGVSVYNDQATSTATNITAADNAPNTDSVHIFIGVKCPENNISSQISGGSTYLANFRPGSKRQFVIVYKHDTENNPYRCIQG